GPHRPGLAGERGDANRLRACAGGGAAAHRRGLHRLAAADRDVGRSLGRRVCAVRRGLRAAAGAAQAGVGGSALLTITHHAGSTGLAGTTRGAGVQAAPTITPMTVSMAATMATTSGQPDTIQASPPSAAPKLPPR